MSLLPLFILMKLCYFYNLQIMPSAILFFFSKLHGMEMEDGGLSDFENARSYGFMRLNCFTDLFLHVTVKCCHRNVFTSADAIQHCLRCCMVEWTWHKVGWWNPWWILEIDIWPIQAAADTTVIGSFVPQDAFENPVPTSRNWLHESSGWAREYGVE